MPSISASGCKAGLFLYGLTHPDNDADSDAQSGKLVAFEALAVTSRLRSVPGAIPGPALPGRSLAWLKPHTTIGAGAFAFRVRDVANQHALARHASHAA